MRKNLLTIGKNGAILSKRSKEATASDEAQAKKVLKKEKILLDKASFAW